MSISTQGLFNEKETVFKKDIKSFIDKQEALLASDEIDIRKSTYVYLKTISIFETFKGKDQKDRKIERFYWISLINFSLWLKDNGHFDQSVIWAKRLQKEFSSEETIEAQRIELCLQDDKREKLI